MKTRIGVCAAALALCAAVTASAEAAEIPAWAAGAVERWDACGKLDEPMPLDHTLTRRELAVLLDSVLPVQEETAGLSYKRSGAQRKRSFYIRLLVTVALAVLSFLIGIVLKLIFT